MQHPKYNLSAPLTWDDVAKLYPGGGAKARPMEEVFDRVASRSDMFVCPEEGTLHKILSEKKEYKKEWPFVVGES